MKQINAQNIKRFLYNYKVPKDIKSFTQTFIMAEINKEKQMDKKELEKCIEIYGKSYAIQQVIYTMAEYIKFIILNDSRGNYNIRRGFEFQQDMYCATRDYCLYLKYIFQSIGIPFDVENTIENMFKDKYVTGDKRYSSLIYEYIQNYAMEQVKELKEQGWIHYEKDKLILSEYNINNRKNGIEAYRDMKEEYKEVYAFFKDLGNLNSLEALNKYGKETYNQRRNLYNDLWYSTKLQRAKNRNASKEELNEIKKEYNSLDSENKQKDLEKLIKQIFNIELEFCE